MGDNTNFFDKPKTDDAQGKAGADETSDTKDEGKSEEPEMVKVGDKEYSQEDLGNLVGLGQQFQEIEKKQGQPVDDIIKSWGDRGNRIGELKTQVSELEKQEITKKEEAGQQLSPEELQKKVIAEAETMGLIHKGNIDKYIDARNEAGQILANVNSVVDQAKKDGKPETDAEALVKHMQETGIKQPEKAYKDLFETELDAWKEKQLKKIDKPKLATEDTSGAGSKEPAPQKVNKGNLDDLLKAHFN